MSKLEVDAIEPQSGTTLTLGASGDAIAVGSGASFSGLTLSDNILFNAASKGIYLGVTTATASNLLDDYEEGTWTPTMANLTTNSGTATFGGKYVKIGTQVTVQWILSGGNFTATANSTAINNLPFSVSGSSSATFTLGTTVDGGFMQVQTGSNIIYFASTKTAASFFGIAVYFTDA